jgi:hypothetical protein
LNYVAIDDRQCFGFQPLSAEGELSIRGSAIRLVTRLQRRVFRSNGRGILH